MPDRDFTQDDPALLTEKNQLARQTSHQRTANLCSKPELAFDVSKTLQAVLDCDSLSSQVATWTSH